MPVRKRAIPSAYSISSSNANGRACACQPVYVGSSGSARSGRTYSQPFPGPPHSHFTEPPTAKLDPERGDVERDDSGGLVAVEDHVRADLVRAADDRLDVLDLARLEEDVADRDEERPLVDPLDDLLVVLADDDLEVRLRLVEVADGREVAALVDDAVAGRDRPAGSRRARPPRRSRRSGASRSSPGGAPTIRPIWSPTVHGVAHQPSAQDANPALRPHARELGQTLGRLPRHRPERVAHEVRRVLEDRELAAVLH